MVSTQEVIDRYFKDGRMLYFQTSDAHSSIEGDTYLTYRKDGGIQLWFGGSNGEVCLGVTSNGEKLESLIKAIVFL